MTSLRDEVLETDVRAEDELLAVRSSSSLSEEEVDCEAVDVASLLARVLEVASPSLLDLRRSKTQ